MNKAIDLDNYRSYSGKNDAELKAVDDQIKAHTEALNKLNEKKAHLHIINDCRRRQYMRNIDVNK